MSSNYEQKAFICDCGNEVMVVTDDDGCGFNFAMYNRYYNKFSLRDKLRAIWRIIRKGKPYTDQMCMQYDKACEIANFIIRKSKEKD